MIVAAPTSPKGIPPMSSIKRYVGAASATVLLAFSLSACGDDSASDAPDGCERRRLL